MINMTLEEAKAAAEIDKNDLDGDNLRQPQHVFSITQELAQANYRKGIAELDRDQFYAKMDHEIRENVPEGEKKPTETAIKLEITRMSKMRKAEEVYLQACLEADQWNGAVEAIKARGFSLQRLGELYSANYFAAESGGRERTDIKDRRAQFAREERSRFREGERKKV